jgi:hypothetical protein
MILQKFKLAVVEVRKMAPQEHNQYLERWKIVGTMASHLGIP